MSNRFRSSVRSVSENALTQSYEKAVFGHHADLGVPGVGVQRPAMAEHDRLPRTPVLVIDFRVILRGNERQGIFLSIELCAGSLIG
jgi:hypothetical protein